MLAAGWDALKLARASIDGAHRGAAAYRSVIQIEAILTAACIQDPAAPYRGSVEDGVACTGLTKQIGKAPSEPIAMSTASSDGQDAFRALMLMVRNSCLSLPVDTSNEDNSTSSASELDDRKKNCAKLVWQPRVRYGGANALAPAKPPTETTTLTPVT